MQAKPDYKFASWLLIRLVGLMFLFAFVSLASQYQGLIGSDGIAPVDATLRGFDHAFGDHAVFHRPSLLWFDYSDGLMRALIACGVLGSLAIMGGVYSGVALFICWLIYLSFVNVAPAFFNFQWDSMLLESSLLCLFLRPWRRFDRLHDAQQLPYNVFSLWLCRWLLFRVMVCSGLIKLTHGCASWLDLTALTHYYETQLLPNPIAWYVHQAPARIHQISAAAMFVLEIGVPCLLFAPRVPRWIPAALIATTQLFMFVTGNHGFINLLTASLCVTLIDDRLWKGVLPAFAAENSSSAANLPRSGRLITLNECVVVAIVILSGLISWNRIFPNMQFTNANKLISILHDGLHITGEYGLYPYVFTERTEVVVEGSNDGIVWKPYEFKYHFGDVHRAPPVVAPMQPRLDWMMRFAALQPARACVWFPGFLDKLLAGSPAVLGLLESNPFPERPPEYIRADVYRYAFTTQNERAKTGDWWKRNLVARFTDARARQALPALASESFKEEPSRADLMLWDGKRYERFAGSWYPASAEELKRSIETYQVRAAADAENRARRIAQFCGTRSSQLHGLSDLSELGNVGDIRRSVGIGEPVALLVPHAAFGFSGLNSAAAYAKFGALTPKRIILLGPYHYHDRPGDSGGECGALLTEDRVFSTPLGDLPVDHDAVRALSQCAYFAQNDRSHRREHSLEMQLPFIRHTFGAVTIVPILIATLNNPQQAKSIGQSISAMMRPDDLIIASCDMTHYGKFYGFAPYQDRMKEHVLELDQKAYSFIRKNDVNGLWRFHEESKDYMCGFPVMTVLMSVLPPDSHASVLDYYTSQDSDSRFKPLEQERCVGYLSAVFLRQPQDTLKLAHEARKAKNLNE